METADDIITLILIYFAIFFIAFSWLFSHLSEKAHEVLLKLLFISSPIWLLLSVYQLYTRTPIIFTQRVDFITDSFTFLALFLLFGTYLLLANWPATSASVIIQILRHPFFMEKDRVRTFWSLLETVKKNRVRVIAALISLLAVVLILDTILFLQLGLQNFLLLQKIEHVADTPPVAELVYIGLIIFFLWFLRNITSRKVIDIPETRHKKTVELNRAINNISIAAGTKPPQFTILAHNNPNSFSLSQEGKPTIFVTSGLLNLVNERELEAIAAHEIAHIQSGRNDDYLIIETLLTILRGFSFVFFFLILAAINPILLLLLLAAILYISIKSNIETIEWSSDSSSIFNSVITIANPPFALINFLSFLIYYALTHSEDYYADLKSVQFTRLPAGLYSALTKLETFKDFTKKLPEDHFHLYFTGEKAAYRKIPMPQPSIKNRKAILEDIDRTLKNFKLSEKSTGLVCSYCSSQMQELKSKGHYGGSVTIDRCPQCGSVWFDNWELYYIADLATISLAEKSTEITPPDKFLCPRCGIELSLLQDPAIPKTLQLWHCLSCKGKWLEHEEIAEYSAYKKHLNTKKK